jgi:hypothetical protein
MATIGDHASKILSDMKIDDPLHYGLVNLISLSHIPNGSIVYPSSNYGKFNIKYNKTKLQELHKEYYPFSMNHYDYFYPIFTLVNTSTKTIAGYFRHSSYEKKARDYRSAKETLEHVISSFSQSRYPNLCDDIPCEKEFDAMKQTDNIIKQILRDWNVDKSMLKDIIESKFGDINKFYSSYIKKSQVPKLSKRKKKRRAIDDECDDSIKVEEIRSLMKKNTFGYKTRNADHDFDVGSLKYVHMICKTPSRAQQREIDARYQPLVVTDISQIPLDYPPHAIGSCYLKYDSLVNNEPFNMYYGYEYGGNCLNQLGELSKHRFKREKGSWLRMYKGGTRVKFPKDMCSDFSFRSRKSGDTFYKNGLNQDKRTYNRERKRRFHLHGEA